jgi:magnesium transporter
MNEHARPSSGDVERSAAVEGIPFRLPDDTVNSAFVELATGAILARDSAVLGSLCLPLHEADLGALIEALTSEDRPRLIELLGADFDYAALTEVDDAVREEILDELPNEAIAEGVKDLETDDAVYILEDLDEADQDAVLAQIPASERIVLERGLDYPEESAGRRMQTDVMAVPPFWTVGQTIDFMRETDDLPVTFYEIFVVDPAHKLTGIVPLNKLLRTKRQVRIDAIMNEAEHTVAVTEDQEDVARLFQTYNLVSIPVVDEGGRLVGTLNFDDIVDAISQEVDEDILVMGGVNAGEELSDKVLTTARGRFSWLFVNLLTAFAVSAVISMFEASIEQMVALAVLMPIVASMGGNAGTQSMTVTVRALATKELTSANVYRVIRREVMVGLFNGVGFAAIVGVVAAIWFGPPGLGFVIAIALMANLLAAALAGVLIPIGLEKAKIDPALASGPFVTTATDLVGFFAFLGVATLWFGLR